MGRDIIYTGIGSRETPESIIDIFIKVSEQLALLGHKVRSGHAPGADGAFEKGCDRVKGKKEIFIPWKRFNGSDSKLFKVSEEALEIASKYHPAWYRLKETGKLLMGRNSYQVLGYDLWTPTEFVLCYTYKGRGQGGTGQAIRIAEAYSIPIFDAGDYENDLELLKVKLIEFLSQFSINIQVGNI